MSQHPAAPRPLIARASPGLHGTARVPGDKSISHRSLMLGGLAVGESTVTGLLEGADVMSTAGAMRALGAVIARGGDGSWRVRGRGLGGLSEPSQVLDMGNAGTGARLLMGILATHPITSFLTGDASLVERPMARVTGPLARMGARFLTRSGGRLPAAVVGAAEPVPIRYVLPVASAQVKSAVLLAGLNAPGRTTVVEAAPTRDHTEAMLRHFGVEVSVEDGPEGRAVTVTGEPELIGRDILVPADISSAAYPLVAALLRPGSEVRLPGVGVNPLRAGLLDCLREMGAEVALENERIEAGEPVADLVARGGRLHGVDVPAARAPSMIDEYPVLAIAAACAEGLTRLRGLAELRVKESDRFRAILEGLAACGAKATAEGDDILIEGTGRPPLGGATIAARLDHRIAMSFLVLGLATDEPVRVDDGAPIETSFPGFVPLMRALGAEIAAEAP